ncbi:type II toxin-antitoxin system HigB family toxin [Alistipes sp. OttesenSCG-928-L06]|nr:type II toxin-antitoxin system HigB family toxin [Alistipes sp. OttesenSCG-928-L06]
MNIVARTTLAVFYKKHADSEIALEEWYKKTKKANWSCFADVKKDFNSVDSVGNQHFIFNIKGNDYRLIAVIKFKIKQVYIRHICTHAEYDKIADCSVL